VTAAEPAATDAGINSRGQRQSLDRLGQEDDMRSHLISARRLAIMAALACAATLTPVAALAATASPASPPGCATAGLVVWDTPDGVATGQIIYTLNFTNLSGHRCTLDGFPGVSAVDLAGGQLGKAAGWSGHPGKVTLANGATATAHLQIADVYNYSSGCNPVTAAGLRVYPPNQAASKIIPFPFEACSSGGPVYMSAGPVT
jgi:hypothetical protein